MQPDLSLFYFPTPVMLIDDDAVFLKAVSTLLSKQFTTTDFEDPKKAIHYFNQKNYKLALKIREFSKKGADIVESDFDEKINLVNISELYKLKDSRASFNDPSVILVDQNMNGYSGIEFCKEIGNLPVKKILITAGMNQKEALAAFNDRVIDFFISKQDLEVSQSIISAIKNMQNSYFAHYTQKIGLTRDLDECVAYKETFTNFISKNNIIEYYAIDNIGSYIGFNKEKETYGLICWDENKLNDDLTIATVANAPQSVLKYLKDKTHGIFIFSEEEKRKSTLDWKKHTFPIHGTVKAVQGKYYFSVIDNLKIN